jgi:PKD repeat protein
MKRIVLLSIVLLVVVFVAVYSEIGYAQIPPIADPNGPYGGTVDVPVPFDGSGSFDPDPGDIIVQYIWDFGDGTVEIVTTPTHTHVYESAGTYPVVLTVASNDGVGANVTTATISPPQDFCKGLADYDEDVDANDVTVFLSHFGRSPFFNPCPSNGPAPVEKTRQTTSYAPGDDGAYQKGVQWPSPRWTNNGDGTITDNLTGLIWLRSANCFGQRTWDQALYDCNTLSADGTCGLTDGSSAGEWRLPSIKELLSIIDYHAFNPPISDNPFINVQPNQYWSSTTYASYTDDAWFASMSEGYIYYGSKSDHLYVWPVRGGH